MNKEFIEKTLDNIPRHIKPIDYLMDKLDIGRESAYRRLRGEIPFTLEEASKLALELNFSMDETLLGNKAGKAFFDVHNENIDLSSKFYEMLKRYCSIVSKVSKYDDAEILAAQNRLPLTILMRDENLFRFYYYKYVYVYQNILQENLTFAQTVVPDEIMAFRNEFIAHTPEVNKFCFIINSRSFFLSICREIHFCFNMRLLTTEDVHLLQNSLFNLLDNIKKIVVTGNDGNTGSNLYFYLSFLEVSTNNAVITFGNNITSQFWVFYNQFIEVHNSEICWAHRELFEIMKKYSILITRSNEIFQTKFFDQQSRHIDDIIAQNFLYV